MPGLSGSRWAASSSNSHRRNGGACGINTIIISDGPSNITEARSDAQLEDVQYYGAADGNLSPSSFSVRASSEPRNMATAAAAAAAVTAGSAAPSGQDVASPAHELDRYKKIVRRLKWKLPFLASGYRQATDRVGPDVDRDAVDEAELMFKLDFFEFYMLIERALVHLQGVFGIVISRAAHDSVLLRHNGTTHSYHANVLSALDHEANPLHPILGDGDVRRQLGRAKDLRNRWKNADDWRDKLPPPLESYDLENILDTIFREFDRAFILAEQHALGAAAMAADENEQAEADAVEEEKQWEFITDAMDWSAV